MYAGRKIPKSSPIMTSNWTTDKERYTVLLFPRRPELMMTSVLSIFIVICIEGNRTCSLLNI